MICGYKFNRGKDLFKDYVFELYNMKSSTSNPVERNIAKLMLNSLYGRFGMKDITGRIQIMSESDYKNNIDKVFNNTILSELHSGDKVVKYTDKLDEKIRKLIKYQEKDSLENMKEISMKLFNKNRGAPSAVQISAAISAYSKNFINEYKNMENIECYYSDTDSVVLSDKLQNHFVGKEIGKMKLEHIIKEGVFARKKLYGFFNDQDKLIIKASGVDKKKLTWRPRARRYYKY
jgi:DNA polymerase type B, organellar and viral